MDFWIPTIQHGCVDKVAHSLHLKVSRQYGTQVGSFPQAPIRTQWEWLNTNASTLPGIEVVLQDFIAHPPHVQALPSDPTVQPEAAAAASSEAGTAQKLTYTPQKIDRAVYSKSLWIGLQEVDDPPAGEVNAGLLGGILRDKLGSGVASISEAQLNHGYQTVRLRARHALGQAPHRETVEIFVGRIEAPALHTRH